MKKLLCLILAMSIAVTALVGCGSSESGTASEDGSYKIRVAHVCGPGAPFDYGAQEFKRLVEERTGGRVEVEVFAGDMTSNEIEGVEMAQNNNLEIMWCSTGALGGFVQELAIFELPFLFEDLEHIEASLAGEFGKTLLDKVSALEGIEAIGFHEDGWRNILTNGVEINSVEDMKGVRMRSMQNEVCIAMYEALGAVPVALSSGEQFTGLQNGVVDGTDNSALYAKADGYIEVVDHICDIHHFYSSGVIICSEKWLNGLPEEDREIIVTAAQEAGAAQREWFLDSDEGLISEYETKGYKVTRPTDIEAWKEKVAPVYEQMTAKYPTWQPLIDMVEAAK